jgi:hypothetical protein
MPNPGRTPPRDIISTLRQEVGSCCPVLGCGSAYLTWHHFDPPWRTEHHHRAEGMIALCREHADQADNGAFTDDQLRELKRIGRERASEIRGRFNWMRQDLLVVAGGQFFYQVPVILMVGDVKCIWFDRDEEGYLQLNFRMPAGPTGGPRAVIEQNFWKVPPAVREVICPPHGRLVEVFYLNGDKFRAEFFNIASFNDLAARYASIKSQSWPEQIEFPLTVVELWETAAGASIEFGPRSPRLPGYGQTNLSLIAIGGEVGIRVLATKEVLTLLFPQDDKTYEDTDVYLTDLIDKHEVPSRLEGFTFINCRIHGPALVYPFGAPNIFIGSRLHHPTETVFFELPVGSQRVGIVALIACRFINCDIINMGIAGTPEQLARVSIDAASDAEKS